MEEQIDQLQGAKFFTTLDLENGFFHVPVEPASRKYTAFCTHIGMYEFTKTPFGLCNSPSSFQQYVNDVFREFVSNRTIIVYMDDIIIPSSTREEGIIKLKLVLETADKNGLKIKWTKCQFLQQKVDYLGFVVENSTIKPSPQKIQAVSKFPEPKTLKHIQSFLGLTGFFRKFVKDYALK